MSSWTDPWTLGRFGSSDPSSLKEMWTWFLNTLKRISCCIDINCFPKSNCGWWLLCFAFHNTPLTILKKAKEKKIELQHCSQHVSSFFSSHGNTTWKYLHLGAKNKIIRLSPIKCQYDKSQHFSSVQRRPKMRMPECRHATPPPIPGIMDSATPPLRHSAHFYFCFAFFFAFLLIKCDTNSIMELHGTPELCRWKRSWNIIRRQQANNTIRKTY